MPVAPTTTQLSAPSLGTGSSQFSDQQLLAKFQVWKKEAFDQRWIYERQWMRNVWYMLNRQWIYFDSKRGQWQDKRLAKWVPRPVTNMCMETVQSIRANFTAINYGANVRPLGNDPINVVTAGVADDYAPILHEEHCMDDVMNEFDFWLLVCGNAWMHTCVDYDRKNGMVTIGYETCIACGTESPQDKIAQARQKCPNCGNTAFAPSTNPDGSPKQDQQPMPKGITIPLSPFEIAYPLMYERYSLSPYTIRLRWRDKSYYEQSDDMQQYARQLSWAKNPQERTMQIFKSLPFQNDLGLSPQYFGAAGGSSTESEGIAEYDVWVKPCVDFPDGQVIRFAGDSSPTVIHSEKENLPGPLPYTDTKGNPIFTFTHAMYNHVGGRSLGSGALDPIIQKQDMLNQLDSMILMIVMRMSNPIWLEPKGAEVEKFTGEPGLVVKWNPLVSGGNAKPERIPGENVPGSMFQYRDVIKQEIEELSGTYDIMKGQKPAGVEAYAALSLLVERGQARFANAFRSRGNAYKDWFSFALNIEQQFGPEERMRAIMMPTKGWAFEIFKRSDLGGSVEVIIEDGTLTPKTSLGERAAIEHLRQLGLLTPTDPDQMYAIYQKFGATSLLPGLDAQVQEAWMNMDRFEKFLQDPQQVQMAASGGPLPLIYKRWYTPAVHRAELIKWCVSDRGRNVFQTNPQAEQYIDAYLGQIDIAAAQAAQGIVDANGVPQQVGPPQQGGPQGPGAHPAPGKPTGTAAGNSQQNATGAGPQSSGPLGAKAQQQGEPSQQATDVRAISYLGKQREPNFGSSQ